MKKISLALFLFMAGCGFSPLYKQAQVQDQSLPVRVMPIQNKYGFDMQKIIQGKMGGDTTTPLYTLTVDAPSFHSWAQTIDSKNFATMMGVSGSTSYRLTENASNKTILKHSTSYTGSYSVVKDPYATVVAERKVKKEITEQLAEQISLHVVATLAGIHNESKTISD